MTLKITAEEGNSYELQPGTHEYTAEQLAELSICPVHLRYEEDDCWNDDCTTCWEKAIKSNKPLDTNPL